MQVGSDATETLRRVKKVRGFAGGALPGARCERWWPPGSKLLGGTRGRQIRSELLILKENRSQGVVHCCRTAADLVGFPRGGLRIDTNRGYSITC